MKNRNIKEESERKERVRRLRGKYAFTKTSSDQFARRKAADLKREDNPNLPK